MHRHLLISFLILYFITQVCGVEQSSVDGQSSKTNAGMTATARMPLHRTDGIFDLVSPMDLLRAIASQPKQAVRRFFDFLRHPSVAKFFELISPSNIFRTLPTLLTPLVLTGVAVSFLPPMLSMFWSWIGPGRVIPEFGARTYTYKLDDYPIIRAIENLDVLDSALYYAGVREKECQAYQSCQAATFIRMKTPGLAGFLKALRTPLSRTTAHWSPFQAGLDGANCEKTFQGCQQSS